MVKLSRFVWLLCAGLGALVAWYAGTYFFDTSTPQISLIGIIDNSYCSQDVSCVLKSNKNGTLSILVDGKPLSNQYITKSKSREHPFTLPVSSLSDGHHTLDLTFADNTLHHTTNHIQHSFIVDNLPLNASLTDAYTTGKVYQGHTLHLRFQTNKQIKNAQVQALCKIYPSIPESVGSYLYECFIPIACEEQPSTYIASIEIKDHVNNILHLDHTFTVLEYPFKKQTIHIDQEKVKAEQEAGPSEKEFEAIIAKLTEQSPALKRWRGPFCTPIDIRRISCEFGAIRTTQHKGRYAHKALDVVSDLHGVVWAPQKGVVVVKDRFAASGNTVVIDHGCGILSMIFHLEDFADISIGDTIAQGNPLGRQGHTGFAKGDHVHWEHRVNNIPVNPLEWTNSTF